MCFQKALWLRIDGQVPPLNIFRYLRRSHKLIILLIKNRWDWQHRTENNYFKLLNHGVDLATLEHIVNLKTMCFWLVHIGYARWPWNGPKAPTTPFFFTVAWHFDGHFVVSSTWQQIHVYGCTEAHMEICFNDSGVTSQKSRGSLR